QIHPLKLATDAGSALFFLYLLWVHQILAALVAGFLPPIVASTLLMRRPSYLEPLKQSSLGRYVAKYMTPAVEIVRLLTLVPMAYGAWSHQVTFIFAGLVVLVVAWGNGLLWPRIR